MRNKNIESPEEALEMSELQKQIYSELRPEKPVGIIPHISNVADILTDISQNITDPEEKGDCYDIVYEVLTDDADEIKEMIDELNEEVPENVAFITKEIDEKFANASNYFLDAIEFYFQFIEAEDPDHLENAKKSIKEGARLLEEADAKAQELSAVPKGNVEA